MKKQQILMIHGGTSFEKYDDYLKYLDNYPLERILQKSENRWKDNLQENLGDAYEVIFPSMPKNYSTKYREWKIWMEKFLPLFKNEVILAGHSLGGTFWLKYLSENKFPVKIKGLILVSPAFSNTHLEKLDDFNFEIDSENIEKQCENILIFHSRDDPVVPFEHAEKIKDFLPKSELIIFEDRGHFLQEEFPEIVEKIKNLR